jgi:hypothetical protein
MKWKSPKRMRDEDREDSLGANLSTGQKFDVVENVLDPFFMAGGGGPFNTMTGIFAGLDLGISSGKAKRGNTIGAGVSAAAGQAAGIGGYYAGTAIGAGVGEALATFLLPGVGTAIGGYVGGFVGGMLGSMTGDKIGRGTTQGLINKAVLSTPRVRFGGNFKDSQPAYTMRQKAEQELSGSLLNARRYLGREAQLMHQ